jgi:phosphate transport system substrate-binding protein
MGRGLSRGLRLAAGAVVLSGAVACAGGEDAANALSGRIAVDGSSTVFPITEAVAEEFQKDNRAVQVTVGISGTGGGFQKFCRGEIDIADASRPIRSTEIEACGQSGVTFIELPIAYDGLAVVIHPSNDWVDHMTVAELKRLWEPAAERTVTRWNHIRPTWPDRPVKLFGAGVDSGTFDYFTEAINGKEKASRGDYTSSEDDNVIVQGIAGDRDALGYFGYAYYEENRDKLKLVAIDDQKDDNGQGPIAPSPESVKGGTYRPLSRPLFIYVRQATASKPEVKAFVERYLKDGATLVREVGYVPLADKERELVVQRFTAGRTGSMYAMPGAATMPLEQLLGRQ